MKTNKNCALAVALVAGSVFFSIFATHAATTNVLTGIGLNEHFSPTNVTISVNDSVIWVWEPAPPFHHQRNRRCHQ